MLLFYCQNPYRDLLVVRTSKLVFYVQKQNRKPKNLCACVRVGSVVDPGSHGSASGSAPAPDHLRNNNKYVRMYRYHYEQRNNTGLNEK
jgi:hypothetical protein